MTGLIVQHGYKAKYVSSLLKYEQVRSWVVTEKACVPKSDIPQVSLGCHVEGATYPVPHPTDKSTLKRGLAKRVLCELPVVDSQLLREFRGFVRSFCRANFTPLGKDTDLTVNTWLSKTRYPEWRKTQLMKAAIRSQLIIRKKHLRCKSFVKRERYPSFKHARTINSRSDAFKCFSGPFFHAVEREVYKLPCFVKSMTVGKRMDYIRERLDGPGCKFIETDHSRFEAHFTRRVMEACELQVYRHFMKLLPDRFRLNKYITRALTGKNKLGFGSLTASVVATRMSGDMCTSLGNGITNYLLMLFYCFKHGLSLKMVVEGDDGLAVLRHPVLGSVIPDCGFFKKLGFEIKMVVHNSIGTAGFCQLRSGTGGRVLVDPVKKMMTTGWTLSEHRFQSDSVRRELLRAKALSLCVEAPGCPVVRSLAGWLLRCTAGCNARFDLKSYRGQEQHDVLFGGADPEECAAKALTVEPTVSDRLVVEEVFRFPLPLQLLCERWFDRQQHIRPIPLSLLEGLVERDWVVAWKFVTTVASPVREPD